MLAALVTPVAAVALAGCGTFTASSPPAGVDGLTIPTPSPDPDDFAAEVTSQWFPLRPGEQRDLGTLTLEVQEPTDADGVPVTPVRFTGTDGTGHTDLFAQDDDGNVWWFGREAAAGEQGWRAGEGGAQAGLFLAAVPRVGDGHRTAYLPGVVEGRADVLEVTDDEVQVRLVDDTRPGTTAVATFARGEGLVELAGSY